MESKIKNTGEALGIWLEENVPTRAIRNDPKQMADYLVRYADWMIEKFNEQRVETPKEIRKYVGKAKYDEMGQIIFRGADKNNLQQFLDVRGWGAIQNMDEFKTMDEAAAFQDRVGKWVVEVINEKLNENKDTSNNRS